MRLIDTAGSVIGVVGWASERISDGEMVRLPGGRAVEVLDVCDDEFGREGGVQATVGVRRNEGEEQNNDHLRKQRPSKSARE